MYASNLGPGKSVHLQDLPEPSLLKEVISSIISCAGSHFYLTDASLTLDWTKFPGISR